MCLYPRLIRNPKYTKTQKNEGIIPLVHDSRVLSVPIGCGRCIECKKAKSREWQVRIMEDIKEHKNGKFIALTFSDQSIKELCDHEITKTDRKTGEITKHIIGELPPYERENAIATRAMRLFNERWRKEYKKAIRHWAVTELGHRGTKNIHLHGIIWTDIEQLKTLENYWKYGWVWNGEKKNGIIRNYVNERTVNYIVKYVSKMDLEHQCYNPKILTSAGIGSNYLQNFDSTKNKYQDHDTNETYRTRTGHKIKIPIYWRNKLYTEEQREKLWIQKLDKQERWVMGERISIKNGMKQYHETLRHYQKLNKELGYGSNVISWNREKYEHEIRELLHLTRISRAS